MHLLLFSELNVLGTVYNDNFTRLLIELNLIPRISLKMKFPIIYDSVSGTVMYFTIVYQAYQSLISLMTKLSITYKSAERIKRQIYYITSTQNKTVKCKIQFCLSFFVFQLSQITTKQKEVKHLPEYFRSNIYVVKYINFSFDCVLESVKKYPHLRGK